MSVEANKELVRRYHEELWRGNESIIDETLHPDFNKTQRWKADDLRATVKETLQTRPDFVFKIDDLIAEGDKVVLRWTMKYTQPDGKHHDYSGITVNTLQDGKIIEDYFQGSDANAPDTDKNKAIARKLVDAGNSKDYAAIDALMTPALAAGMRDTMQWVYATYGEQHHIDITDIMAEGDQVWLRVATRGGLTAEWEGILPAGQQWTNTGVFYLRIVDGKITEMDILFDVLNQLRQLGATITPPKN